MLIAFLTNPKALKFQKTTSWRSSSHFKMLINSFPVGALSLRSKLSEVSWSKIIQLKSYPVKKELNVHWSCFSS